MPPHRRRGNASSGHEGTNRREHPPPAVSASKLREEAETLQQRAERRYGAMRRTTSRVTAAPEGHQTFIFEIHVTGSEAIDLYERATKAYMDALSCEVDALQGSDRLDTLFGLAETFQLWADKVAAGIPELPDGRDTPAQEAGVRSRARDLYRRSAECYQQARGGRRARCARALRCQGLKPCCRWCSRTGPGCGRTFRSASQTASAPGQRWSRIPAPGSPCSSGRLISTGERRLSVRALVPFGMEDGWGQAGEGWIPR